MIEPRNIIDEENEDINENISEFDDVAQVEDNSNFEDDYVSSISDIDFSELKGGFKKSFSNANKKIAHKQVLKKKKKPLTKTFDVRRRAKVRGGVKKLAKVIVPNDRKVIVEGVNKFILSNKAEDEAIRNIGYYKGKKLKHVVFTIDNSDSGVDFNLELFNPSEPLDYLYSTGGMLNSRIQIGGPSSDVAYSDILFYLLSNPTLMVHCKFVFTGATAASQMNQTITVKNKAITGEEKIAPLRIPLLVDVMQFQSNMVVFDLIKTINRPFIPDGMDVMQYKVLAGCQAQMAFYYEQKSLKRFFYEEARKDKYALR